MNVVEDCVRHTLIADAVVQGDSAVLLVRIQDPLDGRDEWRLPGDRLQHGEHPEICIRRVLKNSVGLDPEWLVLAEVESIPGENWQLIFHYRCDAERLPVAGQDLREARFFQVEHLPRTAHGTWERDVIYRVITATPGLGE